MPQINKKLNGSRVYNCGIGSIIQGLLNSNSLQRRLGKWTSLVTTIKIGFQSKVCIVLWREYKGNPNPIGSRELVYNPRENIAYQFFWGIRRTTNNITKATTIFWDSSSKGSQHIICVIDSDRFPNSCSYPQKTSFSPVSMRQPCQKRTLVLKYFDGFVVSRVRSIIGRPISWQTNKQNLNDGTLRTYSKEEVRESLYQLSWIGMSLNTLYNRGGWGDRCGCPSLHTPSTTTMMRSGTKP